ncbi:MAG: thioredoxin domain-containing protein [Bryobacteraceae bacterium]
MMRSAICSLFLLAFTALLAPGAKFDGSPSAPVRLELFSDFECPHCRELHMGTMYLLKNEYVKQGKVYLMHHDIALPIHPHARVAALYADAAQQIGKYDEVANALFARQTEWSNSGNVDGAVAAVLTAADMTKVRALVSDKKVIAEFDADMAQAVKRQLQETPTMVMIHKLKEYPVRGNVEYTFVKRFVDQLLSK